MARYKRQRKSLYIAFIDFKQAFDTPRVKWFGGRVRGDAKCSGGVTLKDVLSDNIKIL